MTHPDLAGAVRSGVVRVLVAACAFSVAFTASAFAQDGWSFGWEVKAHARDSEAVAFPSPFPFPFPVFIETVDPSSHTELSLVSLHAGYRSEWFRFRVKIDAVDLYDRNPTSEDREIDIDELWMQIGRGTASGEMPQESWGAYAKLGKFGRFERQNDRHLESYGLVSTAFNRFEDAGLELGVDIGRNVYARASVTQGNPVFIRDPNALAGDNGIADGNGVAAVTERGSGLVILYDAEVEYDLDFNEPEVSLGLGARFGDPSGFWVFDVLGFYSERNLQETVDLDGTVYGGDLDLLRGPRNMFSLGLVGEKRTESGANLWFYRGGFSFFGQYVDQDLAGLKRTGTEFEAAWRFELPGNLSIGGHRLLGAIAPAVRYSELDVDNFGGNPQFPAVSVRWPWDKWDYGVRVDVWNGIDLTLERADNRFAVRGRYFTAEETLFTLRWRH